MSFSINEITVGKQPGFKVTSLGNKQFLVHLPNKGKLTLPELEYLVQCLKAAISVIHHNLKDSQGV